MSNLTRRISISLLALLLMQVHSFAKEIEFAQVSDIHYTLKNSTLDKYLYFLSLSISKKQPKFVMFLGDNVEKSQEENVIGFMRMIHSIREPYYLVLGNKDAHSLNGIDKEVYLDIVTTFNRNQENDKSFYYFRPNKDVVCVVLDDSSNFAMSSHGEIPDEQLIWLEKLLKKNSKKLFLIFHHTPVLPPRDDYKLSMVNTEKYQEILNKYNNILLISSGHYHQGAVQTDEKGIRHISAPAFKNMPHSYQLIKIKYDKKSYKSPKNVEITVTPVKV